MCLWRRSWRTCASWSGEGVPRSAGTGANACLLPAVPRGERESGVLRPPVNPDGQKLVINIPAEGSPGRCRRLPLCWHGGGGAVANPPPQALAGRGIQAHGQNSYVETLVREVEGRSAPFDSPGHGVATAAAVGPALAFTLDRNQGAINDASLLHCIAVGMADALLGEVVQDALQDFIHRSNCGDANARRKAKIAQWCVPYP